jgi:hypothetical protein
VGLRHSAPRNGGLGVWDLQRRPPFLFDGPDRRRILISEREPWHSATFTLLLLLALVLALRLQTPSATCGAAHRDLQFLPLFLARLLVAERPRLSLPAAVTQPPDTASPSVLRRSCSIIVAASVLCVLSSYSHRALQIVPKSQNTTQDALPRSSRSVRGRQRHALVVGQVHGQELLVSILQSSRGQHLQSTASGP